MRVWRHLASALIVLAVLGVGVTGIALHFMGYRVYVIHTGSMSPTYKPGDVVIDRKSAGPYRAGQVITFLHSDLAQDVVTHRITDVTPAGLIHTKGDANSTADVWDIRPQQVQGRTITGVRRLGYALVFLKQPTGGLSLACATLGLLLLWKLFFGPPPPAKRSGRHASALPARHTPKSDINPHLTRLVGADSFLMHRDDPGCATRPAKSSLRGKHDSRFASRS